jgi:uric acid transporter
MNAPSATATASSTPTRPEDERLPLGRTAAFGLQHVLTMYGGIIAVPLIVGKAAGLDGSGIASLITACLFVGGLATILQSTGLPFLGSKLPLVQGVSFAAVATITAILSDGELSDVFGAIIVASALGFVGASFFSKIIRLFPPVVTGVVITAIGMTLIPVAANWAMGGDSEASDHGSMANIALAFVTLAIVLLFSKLGIAMLSRLSILIGLVVGTGVAAFLGITDFSGVGEGSPLSVPQPFAFGLPTFDLAAIISMTIVILVTMTETTADIIAVGEIVETPVDSRRIANGLRADMLSSVLAPIFSSFTQTAFAQNVGLVAITGVRSRWVVTAGGVIMLALGLLPWLGQVVAAVPMPVLGGAGIVLFGTVAASGIRNLASVRYDGNMNLVIVATSLAFGMIPVVSPTFYDAFPAWFQTIFHSGISSAALMAIVLNLLFNELRVGNSENPSVFAAKPVRFLTREQLEGLEDGDAFVNGKLVDCDGEEVPVVPLDRLEEVRSKIARGEVTATQEIPALIDASSSGASASGADVAREDIRGDEVGLTTPQGAEPRHET